MARRTSPFALALAVSVSLGLPGCESAVSGNDGDRLKQQDWVAETVAGSPVVKPGHVTLSFAEAQISGRAGCNRYFGPAEYGGGAIKVGQLGLTKMACPEPGLMAQESAYVNALQTAERYSFAADKLIITTGTGDLVYRAVPRQ